MIKYAISIFIIGAGCLRIIGRIEGSCVDVKIEFRGTAAQDVRRNNTQDAIVAVSSGVLLNSEFICIGNGLTQGSRSTG